MVNLLTQSARYVLAILMALYAMKCFTVFRKKYDYDRGFGLYDAECAHVYDPILSAIC